VFSSPASHASEPELDGELGEGGLPAEAALEAAAGPVDLAGLDADEPRHPVYGAELVEDAPADPVHAVGLELDPAREVEPVDRLHEAEDAHAGEIVGVDVGRKGGEESLGDVADERHVLLDESVPQLLGSGLLVLDPDFLHVGVGEPHAQSPLASARCPRLPTSGRSIGKPPAEARGAGRVGQDPTRARVEEKAEDARGPGPRSKVRPRWSGWREEPHPSIRQLAAMPPFPAV
jgi:hypothetical protein